MRRPEQWIGLQEVARRDHAAVGDPFDVGHGAIEALHRLGSEIGERRDADEPRSRASKRRIREWRPVMGRADGDERGDPVGEPEPRDGEARVQAAHAVCDHVEAIAREGPQELHQGSGADGDRRGGCDPRPVELQSRHGKLLGDVAEVAVAPPGDRDLVETEDAVGEHDRMAQVRNAPDRDTLAQPGAPHPGADEERAAGQHQQSDDDERDPVRHVRQGSILRATVASRIRERRMIPGWQTVRSRTSASSI